MDRPTRDDSPDPAAAPQPAPACLPNPPSVFALLRQVRQRERDRQFGPETSPEVP
jgi:hypothetical protein